MSVMKSWKLGCNGNENLSQEVCAGNGQRHEELDAQIVKTALLEDIEALSIDKVNAVVALGESLRKWLEVLKLALEGTRLALNVN
eukprot:185457-Amphidinium_carterae.1